MIKFLLKNTILIVVLIIAFSMIYDNYSDDNEVTGNVVKETRIKWPHIELH